MLNQIILRLKEPSTWRGLVALAAALGLQISPELQESIIAAAVGVLGIIEIFRREKTNA